MEEALIEMCLAGGSVRRVEDITKALWDTKVSTLHHQWLNKKADVHIEDSHNRALQGGQYPYVYVDGVKPIVADKCLGMLEAVGEVLPDAKYQRCTVHFYRNVFSVFPRYKVKLVAKTLKAIHVQKGKKASRKKGNAVVSELQAMKLKEYAKKN